MEYKDLERLEVLRQKNSDPDWVNGDLYRLMYRPDLYVVAYERLKSKPGNMTPGADGSTLDGFSMATIENIIAKMKDESFQFAGARRVEIPKANGGKRMLSIAPPRDKVVQEVMRMILEAIYDSPYGATFSAHSHGFRPKRGCHSALKEISNNWSGVNWIIEGDLKAAFDSIDHDVLIRVLGRRIIDVRFLNLVRKALKAGYYSFSTKVDSVIGTPQGSVVSPILSNIFLHELDEFVMAIVAREERGKNKPIDPQYKKLAHRLDSLRGALPSLEGDARTARIEEIRECKRQLVKMPSFRGDARYVRIKYVRYADDWCVGVNGSVELARQIRDEIKAFLSDELRLVLNMEKTHIRHAKEEEAFFLGVRIRIGSANPRVTTVIRNGKAFSKRTAGWTPNLRAPIDRLVVRLHSRGFCDGDGFPVAKGLWEPLDDDQIIQMYNSVLAGILNYYSFVDNYVRLSRVQYILQCSAAKTLAKKHKLSMKAIFQKYGATLKVTRKRADGSTVEVALKLNKDWRSSPTRFNIGEDVERGLDDALAFARKLRTRSKLGVVCVICGSADKVNMHHVKHIRKMGQKATGFNRILATLNRKQIPACEDCHKKIHRGEYDGLKLSDLYNPEMAAQ